MRDNTQELDEILAKHNGELGLSWEDPDVVTSDTKQALLDWHNKRELEARIDSLEYAKISPKFRIEEKIEQLRKELNKYE